MLRFLVTVENTPTISPQETSQEMTHCHWFVACHTPHTLYYHTAATRLESRLCHQLRQEKSTRCHSRRHHCVMVVTHATARRCHWPTDNVRMRYVVQTVVHATVTATHNIMSRPHRRQTRMASVLARNVCAITWLVTEQYRWRYGWREYTAGSALPLRYLSPCLPAFRLLFGYIRIYAFTITIPICCYSANIDVTPLLHYAFDREEIRVY